MYSLSEFQQDHRDMANLHQYNDPSDPYSSSPLQPGSHHHMEDHAMHLDLTEYMSNTYLQVTPSSYNTPAEIYAANGAPNSQHIYDGTMDDQYTHNPGDWMYSHVSAYSPQRSTTHMVANGIRTTHYSSPPSESPASHYTSNLGYPPSRPTLSRQSSQRSWHSEQGLDTQADGNQRATRSLQGTPLTTIPMLPSLAGSNHFACNPLIPQGLGDVGVLLFAASRL